MTPTRIGKVCLTIRDACRFRRLLLDLDAKDFKIEAGGYWETTHGQPVYFDSSYGEVAGHKLLPSHTSVLVLLGASGGETLVRCRPLSDERHPGFLHVTANVEHLLR